MPPMLQCTAFPGVRCGTAIVTHNTQPTPFPHVCNGWPPIMFGQRLREGLQTSSAYRWLRGVDSGGWEAAEHSAGVGVCHKRMGLVRSVCDLRPIRCERHA